MDIEEHLESSQEHKLSPTKMETLMEEEEKDLLVSLL